MAQGFGQTPKLRTKKRKKDSRTSLKLEKHLEKYLGKDWGEGCWFNAMDCPDKFVLHLDIPLERHNFFTEERLALIKKVAYSFGFDEVEIRMSNLRRDAVVQLSQGIKICKNKSAKNYLN